MTRAYQAYGMRLITNHRFRFNVIGPPPDDAPTLRFDVVDASPFPAGWDTAGPTFRTPADPDATAGMEAFDLGEVKVLRFLGVCEFALFVGEGRIVCHLRDDAYAFAIDIWLMGTVLGLWLELAGMPVLHASAVQVGSARARESAPGGSRSAGGNAVGVLATSKGGKSSLAAALMQRGHCLVSDDNLALRRVGDGTWLAVPSYAQMRMWPEQAEHFLGADLAARAARVQPSQSKLMVPVGGAGFGEFCHSSAPLSALYLPERVNGPASLQIERVPLAEALVELVRNTFLFEVVEAFGLTEARFRALGELLRTVPVRRLRYPEGLDLLDGVAVQIEHLS